MQPTASPLHAHLCEADRQAYIADYLSSGASASAAFTRPNDTTAYAAGDAIGAASAVLTFAGLGAGSSPGRNLLIASASLRIDVNAVPAGMGAFRLHLYTAAPDAIADNAAWDLASAGDRAKYQGFIDFPAPSDLGSTLWSQADGINHQVQLADGAAALYGVLQTTGAFTPTAQAAFTVTLRAVSV
jgi:hypothetical protein